MKKTILALILLLIALVAVAQDNHSSHDHETSAEGYYTCPMHPTVVQDEPGDCPICGMDLVKEEATLKQSGERKIKYWVAPMDSKYISEEPGKSPMGMDLIPVYEDDQATTSSNALYIDPAVVQNMGVRTAEAKLEDISRQIRTIGKLQAADAAETSYNLKFEGWIEQIFVDEVGASVSKGDPLFEIYSPQLISAQEEYLITLRNEGRASKLTTAARKKLERWDIPENHIKKIEASENADQNVIMTSPYNGYVLHKMTQQGAKVKAGKDLYHFLNLDEIWVMADIYEFDIPLIELGAKVEVVLPNINMKLIGEVDYIYPLLDPKTRTLKLRIELPNLDHQLKPGMIATIYLESDPTWQTLTVPTEAVIYSGSRKLVFVSLPNGHFEPREVETGLLDDKQFLTEITSGVEKGEQVVTSGQFLLDSESQLKEAVRKLLESRRLGKASISEPTNSETYFTCPMHPSIVQDEAGECPICGMDLVEKDK